MGCGTSSPGGGASAPDGRGNGGGSGDDASTQDVTVPFDGPSFGDGSGPTDGLPPGKAPTSLAITPIQASIEAMDGSPATQQFVLTATFNDGTMGPLGVAPNWSSDQPGIGSIGADGKYTASGTLGGTVTVTATFGMLSATATLMVKLHYAEDPGNVPTAIQSSLAGATAMDTTVKWAYPYDQTVFPRGINESTLQWIGGNETDYYYVHLTAPTFELESYAVAASQQWDFTATAWQQFLNSTSGPAELKVTRWNGATATVLVDEHVIVANGSMRGTIYYAAYYQQSGAELGKVLRIKPGAANYDDFLDAGTTCTSCHTVSANGKTIVYNGGDWPPELSNTFDLEGQTQTFSGFLNNNNDAGASQWALAGLSADGTALTENFAPLRGPIGVQVGAFDPTTGNALPNSGITKPLWMPVFSPDNLLLVYVDPSTHDLRADDWDPVNKIASNDRLIVASSANVMVPQIQYPTVSPDHQWVVYQRGPFLGSLGVTGDLYLASVANPGVETQLNALDGTSYPFAAGSRDQHLNYEPTFAPVAAGGYFWIAFHSRRTYGNKLVNAAYEQPGVGTKQIWVAAFDQAPAAGADPSHPAFYLGGQNPVALNARAFWALSPCLTNGQGCQTGTDCCSGYCDETSDAGMVCGLASGCSPDGSKCTTTADCCNAPNGTTCINSVCSEPPPKPDSGAM